MRVPLTVADNGTSQPGAPSVILVRTVDPHERPLGADRHSGRSTVVNAHAEQDVRVPTFCASWLAVTFVHWPVPAERIQPLLPPGLTVDQYDGSAWVSLTPFLMASMRPCMMPGTRGIHNMVSAFVARSRLRTSPDPSRTLETNLRTYVRGPDGRDGLWFLTLQIGNPVLALAFRWMVGAPYHAARLQLDQTADLVTYAGHRPDGLRYDMVVRPGRDTAATERDVWLTGRWRAYTRHAGQLLVTPVQHEPWPLQGARLQHLDHNVTDHVGIGTLNQPVVHFSAGVRQVRFGVPRLLRART